MNNVLSGKVSLVAGGTGIVGCGIVHVLLSEGATVIVPAKSAQDIRVLKEYVEDVPSGKLITFLTDYPDYDKVLEFAEDIIARFGMIDLAVAAFDTPGASPCLTELAMTDWEKMTDEHITASFICARVALYLMKNSRKGLYVSLSNADDLELKSWSALANITVRMQVEMARIFSSEVKQFGVRYHHLFINPVAAHSRHTRARDCESRATAEKVGAYIVQLFRGEGTPGDALFQWLPAKTAPAGADLQQFIPGPRV